MKLYKASEWKSATGKWYVSNTENLANNSGVWWIPPYIFNISFEKYIYMLKNKYNANIVSYNIEKNVLIFNWDNYSDAHKYLLDVNRIARQKQFKI